jgi:hypothetical protein
MRAHETRSAVADSSSVLNLIPGKSFTGEEIRRSAGRDIEISLFADGILMGGMTYRIDPDMKAPGHSTGNEACCLDKAKELLQCLKLGDHTAKQVRVKSISVDIDLDDGCD